MFSYQEVSLVGYSTQIRNNFIIVSYFYLEYTFLFFSLSYFLLSLFMSYNFGLISSMK
jgi:hypothetical protein